MTWSASWKGLPQQRGLVIAKSALWNAPFQAELRVPARAIERLPPMIRPNDIEGNLAVTLDADGTLANPEVRAHATLERFAAASERQRKAHLDVNLDAEYAPAGGRVALTALRRTEPVLELDSRWTGDARRLGQSPHGKSAILGDLDLTLNEFPLGVVPLLQQHHVRGRLTGTARVKDFGKNASLEMDLRTRELKVERLLVGELHAAARNVQGKLELQTEVNGKAGQAEARISAPLSWGDQLLPSSNGRLDGTLQKTVVVVDLGTVSLVKGQQARGDLSGKIQATLGEELDVQGRSDTKRGTLDISGKTFDIERGTVAFTGGKPDDPTIGAVARYDSPAGYSVYAEYTGTASKGKLAMRSEPALSQDEIVTLLLFGTPDGSLGAGSSDSLSTAVSVAGGTAAQGLNRAISDVTDLDVSARVDTSTGAPRPELVLQLTPRIAAKVTQALGEPVPGQSPDRTFVTLDLRLANRWSFSTMVGDRGASAFDLIWRKRY